MNAPTVSIRDARPAMAALGQDSERWFFFGMALFFFATALVGFIPTSIEKVQAVAAGQRQPLPLILHIHAVVMGTWVLLLLVQASLVASGRIAVHRTLGLVSFVLIPMVVLVMFLITRAGWMTIANLPPGAMPPEALAGIKALVSNILIEQIKSLVLFPLFAGWGIAVRRTDPGAHKRLMLLATLVPMMAAVDRLVERWLPTTFPIGTKSSMATCCCGLRPW